MKQAQAQQAARRGARRRVIGTTRAVSAIALLLFSATTVASGFTPSSPRVSSSSSSALWSTRRAGALSVEQHCAISRRRAFALQALSPQNQDNQESSGSTSVADRVLTSNAAGDQPSAETVAQLEKALDELKLGEVALILREKSASSPGLLNKARFMRIFEAIQDATIEADEGFRQQQLQFFQQQQQEQQQQQQMPSISSASNGIPKDSSDPWWQPTMVRNDMTEVYRTLQSENVGALSLFGAINPAAGRPPLAAGSHTVPPEMLEEILGLPMEALTPRKKLFGGGDRLLWSGVATALLEAAVSANTGIPFNTLVGVSLLAAFLDQILVNGAVSDTIVRRWIQPQLEAQILRHEAGHFLVAYLLGCPIEGIVLSTWAALQDPRFRANRTTSAGTSFYDPELTRQEQQPSLGGSAMPMSLAPQQVSRSAIDRYSIIVMGGIAAEALAYGRAEGGAGDELALVTFLSFLQTSGSSVGDSSSGRLTNTAESIRNQARWGALQAALMIKEYQPVYDALVDALERGQSLGECIFAMEAAARKHNLTPPKQPLGFLEETSKDESSSFLPSTVQWKRLDGKEGNETSSVRSPTIVPGIKSPSTTTAVSSTATVASNEETVTDEKPGEEALQDRLQTFRAEAEARLKRVEQQLQELEKVQRDER